MIDRSSLVLVAVPGQLLVFAAGVVTSLARFGRASLVIAAVAALSLAALGDALRAAGGNRALSGAALMANLMLVGTLGWQAATHLAPALAGITLLLGLIAVGPTVMALGRALRPGNH